MLLGLVGAIGMHAMQLPQSWTYVKHLLGSLGRATIDDASQGTGLGKFIEAVASALLPLGIAKLFRGLIIRYKYLDFRTQLRDLVLQDPVATFDAAPGILHAHCLPAESASQRPQIDRVIYFGKGWPRKESVFVVGWDNDPQ